MTKARDRGVAIGFYRRTPDGYTDFYSMDSYPEDTDEDTEPKEIWSEVECDGPAYEISQIHLLSATSAPEDIQEYGYLRILKLR